MADWQAFATAFLTDTAGYINERKDKAAEYEDKLREDAERNRASVQRKQMMMGSAKSIAEGLLQLGATEELIRSAAASGPTGLTDLNRAFQEASTRFGPDFVKENPEIVNEIARTSATPEELGLAGESKTTLDEFMRSTYGLAAPTPDSYKAEETNLFGRLMGYGAKDQARQRLDSEIAYDGYSYLDLQEAARSAEYTSLVPGASVQYGAPKVFSSEAMVDESQEYQRIIRSLEATDEYSTLSARATIAKGKIDKIKGYGVRASPEDLAELAALEEELQSASTQMQTLRANAMRDLVTQRSGAFFGDTYLDVMGDTIDRTVGSPAFSASLRETTREQEEDVSRPMDDSMAPPADEATGVTTPEQKTYSDPTVLGGSPVAIILDAAGNETIRLTQPLQHSDGTVYPVGTTLPSEDAAPLIEALRAPERSAALVAEATPLPTEVTQETVEAARENLGVAPITREQYDAMSRSEKRELGLRSSVLGSSRELSGEFLAPTFDSSFEIKATADPDTFYEV
ncbi:MAG: hypothetical protein GY820_38095, partial [Gammaproteobacteria bacterium]|nr:hypothetical protein [Gammaproteobacteria bacterium]